MVQIERSIILQIIGTLMQKPLLLNEIDKYQLSPQDFPRQLDKFIFSAIFNLYVGGAELIHTIDVDTYLAANPVAKDLIQKENGLKFLQDCEAMAEPQNFNYYYGKLKKLNLLIDLQHQGIDTSKIYCEDTFNENYSKINEKFEKLTTTDIINLLKSKTADLEKKYCFNQTIEETKAFDGIKDLIARLSESPDIGIRLQGDIYNSVVRGGRKGTVYLRSGSSGLGKALPNYTKIPTPDGWKTVGEIKVGDYLFDRLGHPTKVEAIFPQLEQKQVYKVYFKSGKVAECCEDHLWSYYSLRNNKYPDKLITSTTKEIFENPLGFQANNGGYRWAIPICKPVQYSQKEYSVDPYVMGLILGDGSFRYDSSQKSFYFSSKDEELPSAIMTRMGYKKYKKNSEYNYNYTFELNENSGHKNVWVEDILKDYPLLWQAKSEDKFIPNDYLMGSVEQRYNLLAGLLDTDGSIDNKGRITFTTVSKFLRDNIIELCESLGFTCTYLIDKRREKYTTGECYVVHIQSLKEIKPKLFKLSRKVKIAEAYASNAKRSERRDRDAIIKIEKTEKYADMTCFLVDNPEHLFLMNNFICTHNSRRAVGDACEIAYPIRYDNLTNQWISTGPCEKCLYIMTEQDADEIQTMILAYLTGYNEEIFKFGQFTDPQYQERIEKALDIMEKYQDNFLFARVPDPCASVVKNLFRRYSLQHNVENFFFDYIFSSPAMLNEYRDLGLPEHVCLRLFTTTLKNLAIELHAFVSTSTQVSEQENDKRSSWKDYHNIAGARSIVHLVDVGCIMSRPTLEELKQIESFTKQYNLIPNCVCDIFKNRGGRWTNIRIWEYVDLGTCRTYDLFVTTPNLKPIEDFQIMEFITEKTQEELDLEEFYNDGVVSEKIENQLSAFYAPPSLSDSGISDAEAFGDIEAKRKQVSNKSFEELLNG